MSKWDETSGAEHREWLFGTDGNSMPILQLFDESENTFIGRRHSEALAQNTWAHLVATYAGGGASAGIKIYLNGSRVDGSNDNNGAYAAMEARDTMMLLAHRINSSGRPRGLFDGKMAGGPLGPFFIPKELTAEEVLSLFILGREGLGVP